MDNLPNQNSSSKTLIIVIITVVVLFGLAGAGCFCLFGSALFGGLGMAGASEKTYYPECEMVGTSEECKTCCSMRGHSGQAYGNLINDDGKTCGCF